VTDTIIDQLLGHSRRDVLGFYTARVLEYLRDALMRLDRLRTTKTALPVASRISALDEPPKKRPYRGELEGFCPCWTAPSKPVFTLQFHYCHPKLELPSLRVALLTHLKQTLNLVAAVGLEPTTYGLCEHTVELRRFESVLLYSILSPLATLAVSSVVYPI